MTFSEIQEEIANIMEIPEDQFDEAQKAAWIEYCEELGSQEAEKVDGFGQFKRLELAHAEALEAEGKRLIAKAKARRNNIDRLDAYYLNVMQKQGLKKVKGNIYSISVRASEYVNVSDLTAIPREYCTVVTNISPNKMAIKAALKDGQEIPGASLGKNFSLQIA